MQGKRIITEDEEMLRALRQADKVASTPVPVLIEGASGTGKELLASRIHACSKQVRKRFLAVNCGALNEHLAESELFGHAAGSFTGAVRDRRGFFEEVDGGSLFLDEIGELSMPLQAKLLRVLQEGEVKRIGENTPRPVHFRLIAATNRDLRTEQEEGRFREDLFYRIHVVRIYLPPLRERRGDIPLLANELLQRAIRDFAKEIPGVEEESMAILCRHHWPGNVRELENEIRRAAALVNSGEAIGAYHLSEAVRAGAVSSGNPRDTLHEKLKSMERMELVRAMDRTKGNKTRAARALGLSRQGLKNKLNRHGIG